MCEPFMLAKTGLTVAEHQARTVANYLELRSLAPELPFVPVLQGWSLDVTAASSSTSAPASTVRALRCTAPSCAGGQT